MIASATPRTRFASRAVIAVMTILLAVSGAALEAAPAYAALGTLEVLTPTEGQIVAARGFDVTGTGTDGGIIVVADGAGNLLGTATVAGGAFTVPITFAETAAENQVITIVQGDPANPADPAPDTVSRNIVLPAPTTGTPSGPLVVTSPTDGQAFTTRIVSFSGTAPTGSTVTIAFNESSAAFTQPTAADGAFELTTPLPFELGDTVDVTIGGTDAAGIPLDDVELTITLPAPIASPVITSPRNGQQVTGPTIDLRDVSATKVTVSGTGIPGQSVSIIAIPADEATLTAFATLPAGEFPSPAVQADGTWSADLYLVPGNFTAVATHVSGGDGTSLPSTPVSFSVVRAAVVPQLAATGPVTTDFVWPAGGMLLAGVLLVLFSQARRSRSVRLVRR